jgi:hypothetical protein
LRKSKYFTANGDARVRFGNYMRLFILKIFLCLSGLLIGVSVLTETAFLQNAPPRPVREPTTFNAATPKPKRRNSGNTVTNATTRTTNANTNYGITNEMIEALPTPTPLPANSIIRGRVFYADTGRAVKRSSIMLIQEKGFGGPGNAPSSLTDNDGNFLVKNVRAGTYYAMVNAPGVVSPMAFVDFSKMRAGTRNEEEAFENAFEGFEKIVVDGINAIDVQVAARRGGAIGGRIMYDDGDAAIGVKVEILRKVKDKYLPVIPNFGSFIAMFIGNGIYQTDDRGVYRFAGLPAGEYIVKVTENTTHSESSDRNRNSEFETIFGGGNSLLSIFYPDVFETKLANVISVEFGQEVAEINMTIPSRSLYKVEGKIVSRKDKSPVKARITIRREGEEETFSIYNEFGRREQTAQTDEAGNWKFKELPKGDYKLVIEPIQGEPDYREYSGEYSNSNVMTNAPKNSPPKPKFAKKIQEIKLEDRDLSEMVIELGYGATIAGIITVENCREIPDSVTVQTVSETNELGTSDTVGGFSVEQDRQRDKPKNDFRLENIAEGKSVFYVHVADDDYYVKSAKYGSVDLLAGSLDLKDGDAITNVQIILGTDVGTIKGKVVDGKNDFLKKTEVVLVPTDAAKRRNSSFYRNFVTDEKGEFEKKLAPGEYAVVFVEQDVSNKKYDQFMKWLDEALKDAQKVTIEAGRTENLTVKKIKK